MRGLAVTNKVKAISNSLLLLNKRQAEVARLHGVSREYVRQIADRFGIEKYIPPKKVKPKRERPTIEQRFWKYVFKTDSCWFWIGGINTHGYGRFNMGPETVNAHVASL